MSRFGGGGGGGGGRKGNFFDKGNRRPVDPAVALREKIARAWDEPGSATDRRLLDLANQLEDECRNNMEDLIVKAIVDCGIAFLTKVERYAILSGILSSRVSSFGSLLADRLCEETVSLVRSGSWHKATCAVRFLVLLGGVRVVHSRVVVATLCQLLAPPTTEIGALMVMRVLPWAKSILQKKESKDFIAIMELLEGFIEQHAGASEYLVWAWESISEVRDARWELTSCDTMSFDTWDESFSGGFPNEPEVSDIVIPDGAKCLFEQRVPFRIFDHELSEGHLRNRCDRFVAEIFVLDCLRQFHTSLDLMIPRMMYLPLKFKYDFIMVETIIGQLFQLPVTEFKHMFYHGVIASLLRTMANGRATLEIAVENLFQSLGKMDPELRERFVEWFAFHLSNFGFKWEWERWGGTLSGSEDDDRVVFFRALLGRCVRLAYWSRISSALPKQLETFMPPFPKPNPDVVADPSLTKMIQGNEDIKLDAVTIDAFFPAAMEVGSTFSTFKAVMRRYGPLMRQLAKTDEARVQVLKCVGHYWSLSEGHRLMYVDLLMTGLVVDNLSIVSWVFSEHSASLMSYSPWEILHMAFSKTLAKTDFLRKHGDQTKLENHLREEKDLFLTTFQRFVIVLDTYLSQSQPQAGSENAWFKLVTSQLTAFGRRYGPSIQTLVSTLDSFVFSEDCDARIRAAFKASQQ